MNKLQAADGSLRVTLATEAPMTVSEAEADVIGLYAKDGSYRVTLVREEAQPTEYLLEDEEVITLDGMVYTFTIEDGAITAIVVEEEA